MGSRWRCVELWRYPLKSARGEALDAVVVEPNGLAGDRRWACVDAGDATIGSAKHPRRWGRLLSVATTLADDGTLTLSAGGGSAVAGSARADQMLSDLLGRPVRLTTQVPAEPKLHRTLPDDAGMVPDWLDGVRPGQDTVSGIAGGGRFVDFGAVHIVTTGELAKLGAYLHGGLAVGGLAFGVPEHGGPDRGGSVAAWRFRPNLVLDADRDPEPGQELRFGDVVLRIILPTPRCIVPSLDRHGGSPDRALTSALARHFRVPVAELGRAACFGAYAEVLQPGVLERM